MVSKIFCYIRFFVAVVIAVLSVLAFTNGFYPIKIFDAQFIALVQNVLVSGAIWAGVLLGLLLIVGILFGRVYCSLICPLGTLQELFMCVVRRKVSFQKNLIYKYFIALAAFGGIILGSSFIARLVDPYSIFGNAISGGIYGIIGVGILLILVFFKGRFFCSNICPVGAVLGIISKYSLFKINIDEKACASCGMCAKKCPVGAIDFKNKKVNNETCIKCLKCLRGCPKTAISYSKCKNEVKEDEHFSIKRREFIIGGAVLLLLGAVKYGVDFSKNIAKKVKDVILPPGAKNKEEFLNKCLNCNLCVAQCPMKILKKADEEFGAVCIDYEKGFCDFDCKKCSEVCPSGAIKRIELEEKQKTQIALAQIDEDKCIKCGLCIMKCPRGIIKKDGFNVPTISPYECIGCGMCKSACPVKAIKIVSIDQQKIVK